MPGKSGQPRVLVCIECGEEFVFTVGAQEYFAEHRMTDPKRCKQCHTSFKDAQREQSSAPQQPTL
jgi:hypothetical protein